MWELLFTFLIPAGLNHSGFFDGNASSIYWWFAVGVTSLKIELYDFLCGMVDQTDFKVHMAYR